MKAVLIELKPYDPVTAARVTLRVTNVNDPSVTLISGGPGEFLPLLCAGPVVSRSLFDGDFSGQGTTGDSQIQLRLDEATLDTWARYVWDGADCTIWTGAIGAAYGTFTQIWKVQCGGLQRDRGDLAKVTVPLRTVQNLNRPILYLAFAGTDVGTSGDTGEGTAEVKGVLKPWLSGTAQFVRPVLLDAARQIYCYHGYGNTGGVSACYEGGVSKGKPT